MKTLMVFLLLSLSLGGSQNCESAKDKLDEFSRSENDPELGYSTALSICDCEKSTNPDFIYANNILLILLKNYTEQGYDPDQIEDAISYCTDKQFQRLHDAIISNKADEFHQGVGGVISVGDHDYKTILRDQFPELEAG